MAALAHDEDYLSRADDLSPDTQLGAVVVPVLGPDETLLFAISLVPNRTSARDVPAVSRALMRAAESVMATIDGRPPIGASQPKVHT
jgi:hypothetical protein